MTPFMSFDFFLFLAVEMCLSVVEIKHFSGKRNRILYCYHEWLSYISIVLLLLLCSAVSGFCDDFTMGSVPLGFEINGMSQSKNWVSENGVFAFGFLKKDGDDLDSCEVGIRYNLGNATTNLPVWPVGGGVRVSMNSTIRLEMDGRLVLVQNQNGNILWSSDTSSLDINKASLLDNGNLVLLDGKDKVLWESFSSPTNTLLPGQTLHYPQNLRALSTKSTLSYYSLVISKSGELALVWEHNVTYWRSQVSTPLVLKEARFDNGVVLGLCDDSNKVFWSASSKDFGDFPGTLRRLSLDQDGNLRIYYWDNVTHEWKAGWQAVQEQCTVFGSCGLHSVCRYNSTGPDCECLYSQPSEWETASSAVDLSGSGCRKMVDLGNCRMRTSMVLMEQTVLCGLYPPNDAEMFMSENDCRNYCSNDSSCIAVTSMNDGSGLCTVKRTSFISGYNTHSVPANSFLKVCSVPQAVAAQNVNPKSNAELIYSSLGKQKAGGANMRVFMGAIALIALITVIFFLSVEVFVFWMMRWRGQIKAQTRIPFGKDAQMNPHYSALIRLNFEEIKELTNNFATALGPSHFKGTLPNKTTVVAKVLNDVVVSEKEFRVAVSKLGGTHHRNIVSIKGFCFEPKHKLLLYEYVSNGSLDEWLFGHEHDQNKRFWQERLQIAVGVVRAIAYLHTNCQQCIIHGNLKLENVLLDENIVPKVTDFGLRTSLFKEAAASSSEMPSEEDLYMLGQLLLQIVTCERDVNAGKNLQQMLGGISQAENFIDSDDSKAAARVVKIAVWCMQNEPFSRPSIGEVLKVLEGTLSVDSPPSGFVLRHQSIADGDGVSSIATEIVEGEES